MAIKQKVSLKSTEFQAKNEFILVKPEDPLKEKTTESGLIISVQKQSSVERPTQGEVITVGSDIEDIKPGNIVLWPMTDGLDIEFYDGEFILLRYNSIIGTKKD